MKIITSPTDVIEHIAAAAAALSERKDEVNKLNVFPVPDGDTGTNMSLTIDAVLKELSALPHNASTADIKKTVTHGSLMGARGNSGVITSQIMRGFCDGLSDDTLFGVTDIARALDKSVEVAFSAVRKPVEGTILTVIRDVRDCANALLQDGIDGMQPYKLDEFLITLRGAAYASVQNTPELLPILKENGVVDAGGFGLALLIDGFVSSITGEKSPSQYVVTSGNMTAKVAIEQINDWEDSEYLYCTEFLFRSDNLEVELAKDFLTSMGDCELLVGAHPDFKVHVHTNEPGTVLSYMTERGQVSEVHIHNMRLQSEDRTAMIAQSDESADLQSSTVSKTTSSSEHSSGVNNFGFVAVSSGAGMRNILESLGVDQVVGGGQTMNPSTKDLIDAITKIKSPNVFILPNNKNIIMAANAAAEVCGKSAKVVPTTSVPQSFSVMFAVDQEASFEDNFNMMCEACANVRSGEVTLAIKDAKTDNGKSIHFGDYIGIVDDKIEVVGDDVDTVTLGVIEQMFDDDVDTLTMLAGKDFADEPFEKLIEKIEAKYPDLEIDAHRGEQPLYPVVLAIE